MKCVCVCVCVFVWHVSQSSPIFCVPAERLTSIAECVVGGHGCCAVHRYVGLVRADRAADRVPVLRHPAAIPRDVAGAAAPRHCHKIASVRRGRAAVVGVAGGVPHVVVSSVLRLRARTAAAALGGGGGHRYSEFSECAAGAAVLRAGLTDSAARELHHCVQLLDDNQRAVIGSLAASQWLTLRLQGLGMAVLGALGVFACVVYVAGSSATEV